MADKSIKQVLQNSGHLLLMQLFNFGLPLIAIPYLTRTVGSIPIGQVHFASAIISFLVTMADFGLNITATQRISVHRKDPDYMGRLTVQVLIWRLLLVLLMGCVWLGLVWFVPRLSNDPLLFWLTFAMVPAQVLAPTFFFQGQDRMRVYSQLTILSKVVFTVALLWLVTSPDDYRLVNPLNAVGSALATLIGWGMVVRQLGWSRLSKWSLPPMVLVRESLAVTIGHLGQNIIGTAYMVIAGFYFPKLVYGQFNLADKLIWPFRQIVGVGFQATFPQMSKLMVDAPNQARALWQKLILAFVLIGLLACIGIWIMAPYIITFLNKSPDQTATTFLRLMGPFALLIAVQVPFTQWLYLNNQRRYFSAVVMAVACLSVISLWLLAPLQSVETYVLALTLVELTLVAAVVIRALRIR